MIITYLLTLFLQPSPQQPFPLDKEIKSTLQANTHNVEAICKVTKSRNIYIYLYSIKNNGKQKILVKWDILSKAMYYGQDLETIWEIPPGDNITIILEHPDAPKEYFGNLRCSYITNSKEFEDMVKDGNQPKKMKLNIPKDAIFYHNSTGGSSGALPNSYLNIRPFIGKPLW